MFKYVTLPIFLTESHPQHFPHYARLSNSQNLYKPGPERSPGCCPSQLTGHEHPQRCVFSESNSSANYNKYFELPLYSEADYIALRGLKQRYTEGSVHCDKSSQSEITHTHTLPG